MSSLKPFREVFTFVAGSTPQIITETIYALAHQTPPVHPDELCVITTAAGRRKIASALIGEGIIGNLAHDLGIPSIPLHDDSFVVIKDEEGHELEDIRSVADNDAAGTLIAETVRSKASDPDARLHCSLAGGRKTMSFFLGAALQLFGRKQDRLYHVLVNPEFEGNPAFYYPPLEPRSIPCRLPDGSTAQLSTDLARLELAELPFVRFNGKLTLQGSDLRALVAESQEDIDTASIQPHVQVNLADRTVTIGGKLVELLPVQLALYAAVLRQKTDHCIYPDRRLCLDCTGCYRILSQFATPQALEEMVADYARIYADNPMRVEDFTSRWDSKKLDLSVIRQNISKINRAIREQLADNALAEYFVICTHKVYGGTRYGVRAEKGRVRID